MTGKLSDWPVEIPRRWVERVNEPQDEKELAALRTSRDRGRPYGSAEWTASTARRLGIVSSINPRGRPKKKGKEKGGGEKDRKGL